MCRIDLVGTTMPAVPTFENCNRTLVLGMGNPILGDDGAGVRVAAAVLDGLPADAPIDVSEACVGGLSLMELMVGYEHVILIDVIRLNPCRPGTIRKMSIADLAKMGSTQHVASAHDANLPTALNAGRQMSLSLPSNITIFAIEAENVLEFGEELTPDVADAIPAAVRAVLAELACLDKDKYINEGE
jgi:hydrogenase maturation protease